MTLVLHVVEAFDGGIVQSLAAICRALEGEIAFHILHGRRPDAPDHGQTRFPPGVGFSPWPSATRTIAPGRDRRAIAELRALVDRLRPDLIHAHSSKAGALVRLAFPLGQVPVLYSPRGYSFLRLDQNRAMRAAFWSIERLLGTLPHITVGCGLGEYGLARAVSRRAVLIPNMIDPADLAAAAATTPRPDPQAPLRVIMAGGIRPQKNFPLFCRIAAAFENSDVRFLWIGDGPRPAGLRIPDTVEITGWLGRADALALMAGGHLFLQTSLWEGLPLALLEGMGLGLAALAAPAIGNTELVVEGITGHLCTDAPAFIARLHALNRDRAALAALGAGARRLVAQHHTIENVGWRWLSLYRHYARYARHG